MRTRREAENCVNDLNGYEWFGRKIGVKIDETGGHHALAAAAMAGATIWEGVSFSQTEYEVITPISPRTPLLSIRTCDLERNTRVITPPRGPRCHWFTVVEAEYGPARAVVGKNAPLLWLSNFPFDVD